MVGIKLWQRVKKNLTKVFVTTAVFMFLFTQTIGLSLAATQPPVYTSWYVGSNWYNYFVNDYKSNSPFYNTGYLQPNGAIMILDFGQMQNPSTGVYGFNTWEYGYQSTSTVQSEIESVLQGYTANTSHTSPLTIIIGTNNSNGNNNTYDWGGMGTAFYNMLNGIPKSSQYNIWAGDDIEPGWSDPTNPVYFVQYFNNSSAGSIPIWDFGSFNGNSTCSGSSYSYSNGWTPTNFYYVAWGYISAYPYPELYDGTANGYNSNNDWGIQNAQVACYSIWIEMGVLTENVSGTETASQAFSDQVNALSTEGVTTSINYNSTIQPLN